MSHLKYWLFRQWLYFLLTQAKLPTNRKSYNGKKNKGVNFSENSPIDISDDYYLTNKIPYLNKNRIT